jgi:acyl carrier protein
MCLPDDSELYLRVKTMIVNAVKLKKPPQDIGDKETLFGAGLGLDSVDALELVIAIEKEFGLRIPDAAVGAQALASVESIVNYVKEQKNG